MIAACSSDDSSSDDVDSPSDDTSPASEPTAATADSTPAGTERERTTTAATTTETTPTTEPPAPRCGDGIEPSGPVELRLVHTLSGDVAKYYFPDVVARFEEQHPGIKLEVVKADLTEAGGLADVFTSEGTPPDVVLGTNLLVREQIDSGAFLPVEDCAGGGLPPGLTGLLPAVETTYTYDGTLWAAPYNVSTPLLMYDGNVWTRAGLDPDDPPTTIAELLETARALDESGVVDTGMVLYDKSALWLLTETAGKQGRLLMEPDNGRAPRIDTIELVDDGTIALLEEMRQMKQQGLIAWAGLNADNQTDLVMLVAPAETTGLTLHTSASLGDIFRLDDSELLRDVDVRVAPLPGPGPGASPGGGALWLVDGVDDDRVSASWQLIDWLTQPERIAELAAYTGYVPTTPAAVEHPITVESWQLHPQLRVAYDQVADTPGTFAATGIQVGSMAQVLRAIEIGVAGAVDGNQDPATTMRVADDSVRSVLEAYGQL